MSSACPLFCTACAAVGWVEFGVVDPMENQPASENILNPIELSGANLTRDMMKSSCTLWAAVQGEI